jgi:hypothetical protein
MYNVHFNFFERSCQGISTFQIDESSRNGKLDVSYRYKVNGEEYLERESFYADVFYQRIAESPSELTICYNASFPSYHYIREINFKGRYYHTGLVTGGFFLLLTILFDVFGNKARMAEKYKKAFTGVKE